MDAAEAAVAAESRGLSTVISRNEVTGCELPTAYWHQWFVEISETPASLRWIIVGCDKPSPGSLAEWERFKLPLIIVFGLTETTITSTLHNYFVTESSGHDFERPSIGRPIANTQTYILDADMQPVPRGVAGELYVGGAGLARGYCNQPAITAARFIPNPFNVLSGERIYRTGDLARYFSDGRIEFLGRADEQVKIRGFRVEPEEVEIALSTHPAVRESSVCAREDVPGEKRLIAYVVCQDGPPPNASDLRQHLKAQLPEYMLPSFYVMLDRLPVTPNGKIDRSALPRPDETRPQLDQIYVPPRTQIEELLAGLWFEVLGVNQVGIDDNFFELGGHSLLATKLNSRISKTFSIELPLRTIFELPTIAQLAERIEPALGETETVHFPTLKAVPRDAHSPLSFAQGRLWFLDQLEPGNPFYNISTGVRLKGTLDLTALERTLTDIIRRHEGLRTIFSVDDGLPVQVILPAEPFQFCVTDVSQFSDTQLVEAVGCIMREEAERPFELSQGPLLRVTLLKLRPDDHVVLLSMHHIIADEWSMEMLSKEVAALYTAYTKNEPSPLDELPIQYADYACWQRAVAETPLFEQQLNYWRAQLAGAPQLLSLPTDRPRPPIQTFRGANYSFRLSAELSEKLRQLSRRESVTLFMLLLAAFKVLLYRYTGQRDVVVGTDISGRQRKELEGLIGFFVNQLVLRTRLEPGWSFKQLVQTVREVCLGAYGHQEVPFERVVEEMNVERSLSYGPLFQVSFTFDNAPRQAFDLPDVQLKAFDLKDQTAKTDLTLGMMEAGERLAGEFEYNTDLFETTTIERVSRHFQNLLAGIVRTPEEPLARLPLLDEQEVQQQLIEWNATAAEYPGDLCLHEIVAATVARTPDAVAVSCGSEALSYQELNQRAERLAEYLRSRGVGCEDRVGLLLERTPQLLVAIVAVLKSGGAYVPLDGTYPARRLEWMMADAGVKLLLSEREVRERVFGGEWETETEVVDLSEEWGEIVDQAKQPRMRSSGVRAENAAYVIYTSGSTGVPKASLITHRAAVNFTLAMSGELELKPGDRILQFALPSFDVFVEEVFPAWAAGAAVVLMDAAEAAVAAESRGLSTVISRNEVTGCELPTAYWHQWSLEVEKHGIPPSLRLVIIGGENALRERVEAWRRFNIPLINAYGLTEAAVTSITYTLSSDRELKQWAEFPIGRPISNTDVYVLDPEMQPAPTGVIGNLYVGGTGLGRSYHNRPDLTAERFIPHPFSERPGERLYCTGDLARYLHDSNIENIGRRDFQVKVRGFRIELGEIEAALAQYAGVRECVVLADDTHFGDRRLAAYLAAAAEDRPTPSQLRAYLMNKLPDYMIPSVFVFMDALPLSANGKLERKLLPSISHSRLELGHEYVAPETPTEFELARLWSMLLGLETLGVHDNFFEIGGHSLLATQLVSHIRETFEIELPLRAIFEMPTVAGLAETIDALRPEQEAAAKDLARILESLENLSDEDARALLQEKLKTHSVTAEFV
jgi:amino acid adenylation domain-containing protein